MIPTEHLRDVPGFPKYMVSRQGQVWSKKHRRFLKPWTKATGHKVIDAFVGECRWAKRRCTGVHRLVALAWIGPAPEGMEVCHNDGNPSNNHVSNLRWDTHQSNMIDSAVHQSRPTTIKPSDVPRILARLDSGETQASIAKAYGVNQSQISRIKHGKRWGYL